MGWTRPRRCGGVAGWGGEAAAGGAEGDVECLTGLGDW